MRRRARSPIAVQVALSAAERAFDPLARHATGVPAALQTSALLVAAVLLHGFVLAGFFGLGRIMQIAPRGPLDSTPIEVAIKEPPPPPVPEPEPPKPPEPLPEPAKPEPEVVKPKPAPPKPEPPKPPEPKPEPPPKPEPEKPEPPKPEPTQAEPPKDPPRRIVGIDFGSTVTGGSGPGYAVGNTRAGATATRAADPTQVGDLPAETAPEPEAPRVNRAASRIPTAGVVVTKPERATPVEPAYPETLRAQGIEADVVVLVTIDAGGGVTDVKVVAPSAYPEFDAAAVAAARAQRFTPATRGGVAIAYNLKYTYRFRLSD